jgi:hypothetical protein
MAPEFVRAAIFDGAKPNNPVQVSNEGRLATDGKAEVTLGEAAATTDSGNLLGTSSTELLAEDADRYQVLFQNLDSTNSVHLHFGDDDATTDDLRVGPGASFTFPPGIAYKGALRAIASAADTSYVLVSFGKPAS